MLAAEVLSVRVTINDTWASGTTWHSMSGDTVEGRRVHVRVDRPGATLTDVGISRAILALSGTSWHKNRPLDISGCGRSAAVIPKGVVRVRLGKRCRGWYESAGEIILLP